mmetsp:Transcript_12519/g.50127  ORF Transcript_12519/g.50127 Transcript_12519/m.50127 type:complete len:249 (+) Transcript_12519:266-1012(+)
MAFYHQTRWATGHKMRVALFSTGTSSPWLLGVTSVRPRRSRACCATSGVQGTGSTSSAHQSLSRTVRPCRRFSVQQRHTTKRRRSGTNREQAQTRSPRNPPRGLHVTDANGRLHPRALVQVSPVPLPFTPSLLRGPSLPLHQQLQFDGVKVRQPDENYLNSTEFFSIDDRSARGDDHDSRAAGLPSGLPSREGHATGKGVRLPGFQHPFGNYLAHVGPLGWRPGQVQAPLRGDDRQQHSDDSQLPSVP